MGNQSKRGPIIYPGRAALIKRYKSQLEMPNLSPEFEFQLKRRLAAYGYKTSLGIIPDFDESGYIRNCGSSCGYSGSYNPDVWKLKPSNAFMRIMRDVFRPIKIMMRKLLPSTHRKQ